MSESLGKILKKIRESRKLSIEDVSERSRIPKHIVSILEEDRLDEIKPVFYAKSFVKTYAIFLGALNEPSVKEYMAKSDREPQKKVDAVLKTTANLNKIPQINYSIITKYKKQILAVIIGILVFWALSFAVGHAVKYFKGILTRKQPKAIKSTPARQHISAPVKEKKEEQKVKGIKKEASDEKPDSVKLEVSVSDNTWLQVIGDGEMLFTGLFKKGGKDTWKARKEIKLEAGNSGVIKININGKPANFSGKKGEKKEIIITKDGIK